MQGSCEDCADSKKVILNVDPRKNVFNKEWKYIDNKFQVMTQSKCVSGLSESLESVWDVVLTTINNKRIQSAQFQVNLENPNVRFLQNDFVMSYSCEY